MVAETDKKFLKVVFLKGLPLILLTGLGFFLLRKVVLMILGYEIPAVFLAILLAVVAGLFSEKHIKPYIQAERKRKAQLDRGD